MIITPANGATAQDGAFTFNVEGIPSGAVPKFALSGPGIVGMTSYSFGGSTNIPTNVNNPDISGLRTKTYTGLLPGTYVLYVLLSTPTKDCGPVTTIVTIPNACAKDEPVKCESECGNSLVVAPKLSISSSNPAKHVRVKHIPEYEIGDSVYSVEGWVKPLFNAPVAQTVTLLTIQSEMGIATTLGEAVTSPAPFLYHNFRLVVEGGIFFLSVAFAIDDTDNFGAYGDRFFKLSTGAVTPYLDKPNHVVFIVREIIENSPAPTTDYQVDNTTTPLSNKAKFNKAISFYLNGVLIDTIHPNSLAPVGPNDVSLTPSDRLLLKNINNLNGYLVIGSRYHTMDTLDNGEITNVRWYGRELTDEEIKTNFLAGCHGKPSSCERLLAWFTLNQIQGNILPENINSNHGEAMGYTNAEMEINGGAYTISCCPETKLEVNNYCPPSDCDNALLVKYKPSITNSDPSKHVRLEHISQYKIGESEHSLEAWVQPLYVGNITAETKVMALQSIIPITTSLATAETANAPYLSMVFNIRYSNGKYYLRFGVTYEATQSYFTSGVPPYGAFFICTNEVVMDNTKANQVVWVIKDILEDNATPTQTWQIDRLASNAVNKQKANYAVEMWLNGIKIDSLHPDTFDINDENECTLNSSQRLTLRNLDNYIGDVIIGSNYYTMQNEANAKITNLRWYGRALKQSEIQENFWKGCGCKPSNCDKLLIYLPLKQDKGAITPELVYKNNGQLIGYSITEIKPNKGAWVPLCCEEEGETVEFNCDTGECTETCQSAKFGLQNSSSGESNFVMVLGAGTQFGVDFTTQPNIADLVNYPVFFPVTPATLTNDYDRAVAFVNYFNSLVGNLYGTCEDGAKAYQNLNIIEILAYKPDSTSDVDYNCFKGFGVYLYNGTTTSSGGFDLTPFTGTMEIIYPEGQQIICCGEEPVNTCTDELSKIIIS